MSTKTPPRWSKSVTLKNGTSLLLRPISSEDKGRLRQFYGRLSLQSTYYRFMSVMRRLGELEIEHFTELDFDNEMAIVGVVPDEKDPGKDRLIAVGQYVRLNQPTHAEVAFAVEDAYQGLGIGTHLLQELLPFARLADIEVLEAEVLTENRKMLQVFRDMGFHIATSMDHGVVHIEFPIQVTDESQERRWLREQRAAVVAMERIFRPRSVVVVGASNREGSIGYHLVGNLLDQRFAGPIYPVNPRESVVCSLTCYPSVLEVPHDIDLAVIAVPAASVPDVVRQCAARRVHAVVVVSAGFAETGQAGRRLQDEVLQIVRRHGMRMVGPNCMGLLNTERGVRLNATFAAHFPPAGQVAFSSQSGALGLAILNLAKELRLGISQFVSAGNKADISGNDLLYFWGNDPGTKVILLYLESFGNPKKFSRIARQVSRTKPIIVLKGATSAAGARAASSHTGALASSNVVARTLLEQAGIIQTDTMEQLFAAAKVLGSQPLTAGARLGILTNAGGPGILSADRAEVEGLAVPVLSDELQARLREHLPPAASTANPVDMIASANAADYETCLRLLLESDEVDQVVVMFIPPMLTPATEVAQAIIRARESVGSTKPLLATLIGDPEGQQSIDLLENAHIPTFRFPEDAVVALSALTWYSRMRSTPLGTKVTFADADKATAEDILLKSLHGMERGQRRWLSTMDSFALLRCYGIPCVPTRHAADAADAAKAARDVGFPVALKLSSSTIVHKTDVRGVYLDLEDESAVRAAFRELSERLARQGRRDEMDGVLIQPMAKQGLEAVLGVHFDEQFGPVMMAGLGGIYLELFQDVQFSLHPLTDLDARNMISRLKSSRLFQGYRGGPALDVAVLEQTVLRLSQMVDQHPQILDVDLNPVLVLPKGSGCMVLDVRFQVAPADMYTEFIIRQLDD